MDRGTWQATVHEVAGVGHDLATKPPQPPYDCISLEVGKGFPSDTVGKESVVSAGDTGDTGSIPGSERSSGGGHGSPLHSSIFAWRIPWTEEPDRIQSVDLQRVRHD